MFKKICKLFLIFSFFFLSSNVSALTECSSSDMKNLAELAKNVSFKYEKEVLDIKLTEDDEDTFKEVYYKITALNLNDSLKIKVKSDEELIFTNENPTINDFFNGERVVIQIYANTPNLCSGNLITTKVVELPFYNIFSEREECKTYPDFKYCKEFGDFSLDEETFLEELDKYKKSNIKTDDNIKENVKKYGIYASILIILAIIILLVATFKKNKKVKVKEKEL